MLRVLLYVTVFAALFVGMVFSTGNAIGAWEKPTLPLHAPDANSRERTKAENPKKKQGRQAKRDRKR